MTNLYQGRQTWVQVLPPAYKVTTYEVAARALIVHEGRVLLAYEADTDCWLTPGGRLTPGEPLLEALAREIDEETGLACNTGDLVACFDVLMPRQGYIGHKFEFIFAAMPLQAPDFIEREHMDGDQAGAPVSKLRWFTAAEAAALPNVFPRFLRNWPSLLTSRPKAFYGNKIEEGWTGPATYNQFYPSARLVLTHDESILMVINRDGAYWYGPGGRIELGEELLDCAARELHEETGLSGTFDDVVAVDEFFSPSNHLHQFNLYTVGHLTSASLPAEWTDVGQVGQARFFSRQQLAALPRAYPSYMAELAWPASLKENHHV